MTDRACPGKACGWALPVCRQWIWVEIMFIVDLNKENFEYDIQALVKAFYPGEQVQVLTPQTREETRLALSPQARMKVVVSQDGADLILDGAPHRYNGPQEGLLPGECPADGAGEGRAAAAGAKDFKDGFKRFLYEVLSRKTGQELPWGNLTGIRPTKIAYGLLEQGESDDAILDYYRKSHYVSRQKAELSLEIAKRERALLERVHFQNGYSLYVGIPFCPTTCLYCSFPSFPIGGYRELVETYLDCLIREMELTAQVMRGHILDSVYIGGGTPTTLEPAQLERLLVKLRELFDFSTVQEFTVEAGRADSITREKLKVLYDHGVSRISVNPQTMKQETLDLIGRRATVEQVEQAFWLAREIGFDNINMDLILGLPGELAQDVQHTADRVVELGPDSLTVHSLAIKRASRLNRWIQENGVSMLCNTDETMAIAAEGARRLGLLPYYLYRQKNMSGNFENVGYAREGKFGLYNILIMEEVQTILALGAGSISKKVSRRAAQDGSESILIERCENVKEVALYIRNIEEMLERKRGLFCG